MPEDAGGARLEEAFRLATRLHDGQTRKGTDVPYISHLMAVCAITLENGGSQTQAIAALLHDAVEDQGGDEVLDDIRTHFGEDTANIVLECSEAYDDPTTPWRVRKEGFLAKIPQMSDAALLVCLADKFHNASTILADYRIYGEDIWGRFNAGRHDQIWYYREVSGALSRARFSPLAENLKRTVVALEKLCATAQSNVSLKQQTE